jgi:hypothetical protein
VAAIGLAALAVPLDGADRLRARIWPAVASAPAAVRVEVLIEPAEDNRALEIVADSGDYYRSSTIALEGARSARFHAVLYRGIPAGVYEIRVVLVDAAGAARAVHRQRLEVVP